MFIDEYENFELLVDKVLNRDQMIMQDEIEIEIKKLNKQLKYFDMDIDSFIIKKQ